MRDGIPKTIPVDGKNSLSVLTARLIAERNVYWIAALLAADQIAHSFAKLLEHICD
jgi:hypothetical protein